MLIIVESPAKAKTISKIVGSKHVVKASVGHIRSLSTKSKTKDGRKLEISGVDIEKDFLPVFEIDSGKKKVVAELKKLAKAEKDGILFATDSDREGEAISWHLAEVLGIKDMSSIKRLEFHEITKKAINEALENPTDLNMPLVEAQKARQVLDKLVGFKLSPVLWAAMGNRRLSAGRVQSPALVLICSREKEIEAFNKEEFWEVKGKFNSDSSTNLSEQKILEGIDLTLEQKSKDLFNLKEVEGEKVSSINSQTELDNLVNGLNSFNKYNVDLITTKATTQRTKPPFTTSTLQQAASSKLGFSPKMTMGAAQKLYEGLNISGEQTALITYMRTDSVNLSAEAISKARGYISSKFPDYLPESPRYYKGKSKNSQEAHEAVRPTDPSITPDSLYGKIDDRLWKLYDLIWKQTIASQMNDEKKNLVTFILVNERNDKFSGSTSYTTHLGFKAIWGGQYSFELDKKYSSWEKDSKVFLEKIFYYQKFTRPPARYSAASLIKKMEELGIGRPSTYASIISTLMDRKYVQDGQKSMEPTSLGIKIGEILIDNFKNITGAEFTAKMEDDLDEVSLGKKTYLELLEEFWTPFKKDVESKMETVKENREKYNSSSSDIPCPTCKGEMLLRVGRFGEYLQCQTDKTHMFSANFRELEIAENEAKELFSSQTKGTKCEDCKDEMIVRVAKSSLKPYLACAKYKVGNKHTVTSLDMDGIDINSTKYLNLQPRKGRGRKFTKKTTAKKKAKSKKK